MEQKMHRYLLKIKTAHEKNTTKYGKARKTIDNRSIRQVENCQDKSDCS